MADSVLHGNKIEGIRIKDVKIMAKKFIYTALAGVSLLFAGCSEDLVGDYVQPTEKHFGEEIVFGGSASYDVSEGAKDGTRTVYGGYENITDGAEPVYWKQGDAVRVYCPEGANNTADYDVYVDGEKVITTSLSRRGESALQWGNPNNEHTFYAVYPAPSESTAGENLNGTSTIVGTIPSEQPSSSYEKKNGYDHVFTPNMNYAYMVAKTVIPVPNNIGESVYLRFMPIATALEITLQNGSGRTLNLKNVELSSKANYIAGSFASDLKTMTVTASANVHYGTGYPETTLTGNASKSITIPFAQGVATSLEVKVGESVTFTAFMLPTADITDLQMRINGEEGGSSVYKTATFQGVSIKMKKKTYFRNLAISATPYTDAEWFKAIYETAPSTKLNALSIPAAGGAGSGYTTEGSYNVEDNLRQQNYDIPTLWNMGVRCFEFAVDIASGGADGLLGQQPLLSGGSSCGITLGQAVTDVVNQLVANPQEFAMVILTYQNTNGWGGMEDITRDPAMFMKQANVFWGKMQAGLIARNEGKEELAHLNTALYSPDMTVEDAHGKLFCICRPTSIYQDYGEILNSNTGNNSIGTKEYPTLDSPHEHMVVIQGWGALKDKWQQRGYSKYSVRQATTGNDGKPGRPFDVATLWSYAATEWWNVAGAHHGATKHTDWNIGVRAKYDDSKTINAWYGDLPSTSWTPGELTTNFTYETSLGQNHKAWIQEWARVSNFGNQISDILALEQQKCSQSSDTHGNINPHDEVKAIYWSNTKQEKINNIREALDIAIGKTPKSNHSIYINSLCGYYVDSKIESSYLPLVLTDRNIVRGTELTGSSITAGMAGNIQLFAHDINKEFNTILHELTADNNVGPMGIIMMDRVGEVLEDGDESSKVIPKIIISNNFKFQWNSGTEVRSSTLESGDKIVGSARTRGTDSTAPIITWE